MATRITKTFTIDAAHRLPRVPAEHPCGRMHGHTYRITVALTGAVDPQMGWIADFAQIKAAFAPLKDRLDHVYLNEVPGLENPTAELLARWIYERLQPALPHLSEVIVEETPTSTASYQP